MHLDIVVYEHAARCLDLRPWTVSRDATLLADAHHAAHVRYGHAPLNLGIDIYNIEAEAYGARVDEPLADGLPSINAHPCTDLAAVLDLHIDDWSQAGRVPMLIAAAQRLRQTLPEVPLRIPLCGPFSLATHLLGLETVLMALFEDPQTLAAACRHLALGQERLIRTLHDHELSVSLFESAATPPLVPPDCFTDIIAPCLEHLCAVARHPALIIGGDTLAILPDMLTLGAGAIICPVETDQAAFLDRLPGDDGPMVRVNMDPAVFAAADPQRACTEAGRVASLIQDRPRCSLGSGILPLDAQAGTVQAVKDHLARI